MPSSRRTCAMGLLLGLAVGAIPSARSQSIAQDARSRAEAIAAATPPAPWGCTVLLCLANPNGPTAVAQCVDPIRRLRAALRSRQPFPTCPMAQAPSGGAYARLGSDPYDPCPSGTTPIPAGRFAMADVVTVAGAAPGDSVPVATAASPLASLDPAAAASASESRTDPLPPRLCGNGYLGDQSTGAGESIVSIAMYRQIVVIPPAASPDYIEVLVDRGDGSGYTTWTRTRY